MATKVDDEKLDGLMHEIVDCLSVLLDRQMKALDPRNALGAEKWGHARKGLTSAYISLAEAQCAGAGWGLDTKAINHTNDARQKLREMMAKLESPS